MKGSLVGVATAVVLAAGPWWVTAILLALVGGLAVALSPETQENLRLLIFCAAAMALTPKAHERLCKLLEHKGSNK